MILLEEGLAAAGHASSASAALALFVAVAQAGLDVLEPEPREPVLLNYTAVALYELWSIEGARALFAAAGRLDPDLAHVRRNLAECKRRARELSRGRARRPMHAALPALAARAKRVAAQAQPAQGLKLSLCMIVRDEEEMLPRCLAAAAPAVDEIVIVDTGSTDRTIEIARSFGARVIEREWTGSFSEARNVSFEAATGDWIIYLDADEVLVADDVERLRALTGHVWREAFYLVETSFTGQSGDGMAVTHNAMRVFRNRPSYRFEGRLHEQIAHQLPTCAPGRLERTQIRVEHYGYLGAVRDAKEKSRRNIELLRAQAAEGPADAFLHFNLGTEYLAAGRPGLRADRARARLEADPGGGRGVPRLHALAARAPGRRAAHVRARRRTRSRSPTRASSCSPASPTWCSRRDWPRSRSAARTRRSRPGSAASRWATAPPCTAPPSAGARSCHASCWPRCTPSAASSIRSATLLEWCIREHPEFIGVVAPYATVLLRTGSRPRRSSAEIERRAAPGDGRRPLHARLRAVRGRRDGRRPSASTARCWPAGRTTRRPGRSWPRRCCTSSATPRPPAEAAADRRGRGVRGAGLPHGAVGADRRRRSRRPLAAWLTEATEAGLSASERAVFLGWLELAERAAPRRPSRWPRSRCLA